MLQLELMKLGHLELAGRVVVDTVPYTSFFGDIHKYNAIKKATGTSSEGQFLARSPCPFPIHFDIFFSLRLLR